MVLVHDSLRPGSGIAAAVQGMPSGTIGSSFEMSRGPGRERAQYAAARWRSARARGAPIAWHGTVKAALSVESSERDLGERSSKSS